MKASQQAIERGVKDCLFIDFKRRSGHFDVTTVASIKEITEKVWCQQPSGRSDQQQMKPRSVRQHAMTAEFLFNPGLPLFARHRPARHRETPQRSHLPHRRFCPLQKRQADQVSSSRPRFVNLYEHLNGLKTSRFQSKSPMNFPPFFVLPGSKKIRFI